MLTFGGPPPSPLLVNVFYGCSLWPIAACHCSVVPFPLPPPVENNFRSKVISTYCVINLTDNFGEDKTQVVLHREVNDSQKMNFALLHSFWKIAEWIYWYHLTSLKHLIGFFVVLITVRFFYEWSQKKDIKVCFPQVKCEKSRYPRNYAGFCPMEYTYKQVDYFALFVWDKNLRNFLQTCFSHIRLTKSRL